MRCLYRRLQGLYTSWLTIWQGLRPVGSSSCEVHLWLTRFYDPTLEWLIIKWQPRFSDPAWESIILSSPVPVWAHVLFYVTGECCACNSIADSTCTISRGVSAKGSALCKEFYLEACLNVLHPGHRLLPEPGAGVGHECKGMQWVKVNKNNH